MDGKLLKDYISMAKLIGETFGKNCEVVIHDLSKPQSSVIFVMNNHVTGRKVGQSFDHLIKEVLLSSKLHDDQRCNYIFTAENGALIKSSTMLIRDAKGQVVGALCINIDISALVQASNTLLELAHVEPDESSAGDEARFFSVSEVLDGLIEHIVADADQPIRTRKSRLEAIAFMENKGVFLVKGSIDKVAEKMGVSPVTVYSYLDEVRKQKQDLHGASSGNDDEKSSC